MNVLKQTPFRIQSYTRRIHHFTKRQRNALSSLWPKYGVSLGESVVNLNQLFGRHAPVVMEIGFGMGEALLAMAQRYNDMNFLGVEVYRPGVGALLSEIESKGLTNIRLFCADVLDVLNQAIDTCSLTKVCIFFPDPWPKKRHHKRRLVNSDFLDLMLPKLIRGGEIHLATDWEDYANHMMEILGRDMRLVHQRNERIYPALNHLRPSTKFARRALALKHQIYDLCFTKQ